MATFVFLDSKTTASMKLKDSCKESYVSIAFLCKKSYAKPRKGIKKQRHHFGDKGLYSQSYVFFQYSNTDVRFGP